MRTKGKILLSIGILLLIWLFSMDELSFGLYAIIDKTVLKIIVFVLVLITGVPGFCICEKHGKPYEHQTQKESET